MNVNPGHSIVWLAISVCALAFLVLRSFKKNAAQVAAPSQILSNEILVNLIVVTVNKIFSGRFIVTVMMAMTYCYLVAFIITKLSDKVSGDFALGFVGGFSTSFMLILQWYFDDHKANKENPNGSSNGKSKEP